MKRLLLIVVLIFVSSSLICSVKAENQSVDLGTDEIMGSLDTDELDELLSKFGDEELSVFGYTNIKDKLSSLVRGEEGMNFGGFIRYLCDIFLNKITNIVPFIVSILSVILIFSLVNAIKGRLASQSTEAIVRLACISLVMVIVFAQIIHLVTASKNLISFYKEQMDCVFPVLLTLMTAIGPSRSAAVYQPSIAILSSAVINAIIFFALPCFILSVVFHVVGNLSEGIKLKSMADFFSGLMKWALGTVFFVFLAVLSIQGVTASIYDNIYIRTTKLAISRYVPIIGGYLSEGYNLVISGSVLIKNGVGLSGMIMLALSTLPIVIEIVVFSASLKAVAAVSEPLGSKAVCEILNGIGKSVSGLIAIILGTAFLYFIFMLLIVATGNLGV